MNMCLRAQSWGDKGTHQESIGDMMIPLMSRCHFSPCVKLSSFTWQEKDWWWEEGGEQKKERGSCHGHDTKHQFPRSVQPHKAWLTHAHTHTLVKILGRRFHFTCDILHRRQYRSTHGNDHTHPHTQTSQLVLFKLSLISPDKPPYRRHGGVISIPHSCSINAHIDTCMSVGSLSGMYWRNITGEHYRYKNG